MKKHIILLSAALIAAVTVSAAGPAVKSIFVEPLPPVTSADSSGYTVLDDGRCLVRMLHNDKAIMLQCVVRDKALQNKFVMQGLTVSIDIRGRKSRKWSVVFPEADRGNARTDMKTRIQQMAYVPAMLKVDREESVLSQAVASIACADESLVYGISLPLTSLGGKTGKKREVAVGLHSEMPTPSGGGPDMTAGRGPGGGGPPGGGMRGGHGGGMGRGEMRGGPGEGASGSSGMHQPMGGEGRPSREAMTGMMKPYDRWIVFSLQ